MELTSELTDGSVCSFASGPNGWLYFGNGVDPVMRWKGTEYDAAVEAGLAPPDTSEYPMEAVGAGTGGAGAYEGTYKAFVRFLDSDTNLPSCFDSVGVEFTLDDENSSIQYTNIPTSGVNPAAKTIYRQIWRTTAGQASTYYLDVTLPDDTDEDAESTKTDEQLRAGTAMRFLTADGFPNANRFVVPPDHFSVIVAYHDRLWFIVSDDDDFRRTVMFSEAGEPESVPAENALNLEDDGDELTGGMVAGAYLYILARHHIYRLGTSGDPRNDASAPMVCERGCCNQRCWTRVEGRTFILDEDGPWVFDGSGVDPIGEAVHDYVTTRINWAAKDTFSVAKDTMEETVRFFVALDSETRPKGALAYSYRNGAWWWEDYAGMGSGSEGSVYATGEATISGIRRTLLSADFQGGIGLVYLNSETYDEEAPIDFELKLGAFQFLPVKQGNERRFELFFEPVTVATGNEPATLTVEMFLDGSSTAEKAAWSFDNDLNCSTTIESSLHTVDMSDPSGYHSFAFSGGMARTAPVPRMVEFVLSGTAYQHLTLYEVRITGVQ